MNNRIRKKSIQMQIASIIRFCIAGTIAPSLMIRFSNGSFDSDIAARLLSLKRSHSSSLCFIEDRRL